MAPRRSANIRLLVAAFGGAGLAALCLAGWLMAVGALTSEGDGLAAAQAGRAPRSRPLGPITYDPEFSIENRPLGPAQQFEIRVRLVLPNNPHGYSLGVRRTVDAGQASLGHFLRLSARLPGPAQSPRPRLELSIISRDNSR